MKRKKPAILLAAAAVLMLFAAGAPSAAVWAIHYENADGTPLTTSNPASYSGGETLILSDPERPGYIFAGWTGTELAQLTAPAVIPAGSTGERSYTAHWYRVGDTRSAVYTGAARTTRLTVELDGTPLREGEDYFLSYTDNVNAGTAWVTVTGSAAHPRLSIAKSFLILPGAVKVLGITARSKTYDGTDTAVIDTSGAVFIGKAEGDRLTVTAQGAFQGSYAGSRRTVALSDLELGGADKENYYLAESGQQAYASADIYPAELSGVSAAQRGGLTDASPTHQPGVNTSGTTVDGTPVLFTYARTPDGPYSAAVPTFPNAGSYTVFYRAYAPNHQTVRGSFPVKVTKGSSISSGGGYVAAGTRAAGEVYTFRLTRGSAVYTLTVHLKNQSVSLTRKTPDGQRTYDDLRKSFSPEGALTGVAAELEEGELSVYFDLPEYTVRWGEKFAVTVNNHLQDEMLFIFQGPEGAAELLVNDGGYSPTSAGVPVLTLRRRGEELTVRGAVDREEESALLEEGTDYFLRDGALRFIGKYRSRVELG